MYTAKAQFESTSPLSMSRFHNTEKKNRELSNEYEKRTWKAKCHLNKEGYVYIPNTMFKNSLAEAAKFLGLQIPGKGKSTYTKHIEAGVIAGNDIVLDLHSDQLEYEECFVPSDGVRGSGKRVIKWFPFIPAWKGEITFFIFDEVITKEAFLRHLQGSGQFVGIGRWRPRNNGNYGRFAIKNFTWEESEL